MLRGVILGAIWGLVIVIVLAVVLSLSAPIARLMPPDTPVPEVPAGTAFDNVRSDLPARLPAPISAPDRSDIVRPDHPQADDTLALAGEALQSLDTPELSAPVSTLPEAPAAASGSDLPAPATADPVYPSPQAVPPAAPAGDSLAAAELTTPQPPRAAPDAAISGFPTGDLSEAAETPPAVLPAPEPAPAIAAQPAQPAAAAMPEAAPAAPQPAPAPAPQPAPSDPAPAPAEVPAETPAETPVVTEAPAVPEAPAETPAAPAATAPDAPVLAETPADTPAAPAKPVLPDVTADSERALPGQPATRLTDRAPEAAPAPAALPEPDPDLPPIDRYAAPFANPEGKPILSIVMIDDGTGGADLPPDFPFPLSIAIPVTRPDAAQAMARYRAAGHEVLALAGLPDGAAPQDLETAAADWFARLDQVVAVMETPDRGLQSDRATGEQLAAILADSGHGLLLYPEGLDTARKLASRRGVPAATVFRDLDDNGQNAEVIRRFLDNSAFKAGLEGSVILVTRLRPDTVAALLVWGLADRADRVALAPVSHALRAATP